MAKNDLDMVLEHLSSSLYYSLYSEYLEAGLLFGYDMNEKKIAPFFL